MAEPTTGGTASLRFSIREGTTDNLFVQDGDVAAHLLVGSDPRHRVVIAFPAGNCGAALWFDAPGSGALSARAPLEAVREDGYRGVRAGLTYSGSELAIRDVALGNLRVVRDVDRRRPLPYGRPPEGEFDSQSVEWEHQGGHGRTVRLRLSLTAGQITAEKERLMLRGQAPLQISVQALCDEDPLTPLATSELLSARAGTDERSRQVLAFLSYREKLCAGSWRFLTYFGRDTLLTLQILMPALAEPVIEAGIASVLERLSPEGRVAHEEELGEFAMSRHRHAPHYDWSMVDDDFMLAPVVASYLVEDPRGRERATAFLAERSSAGPTYGELLLRNMEQVAARARPFAETGDWRHLIAIEETQGVGNWRDSSTGLAGGVYPWDVNAALVPAALRAIIRLQELVGSSRQFGRPELESWLVAWRRAGLQFQFTVQPDEFAAAAAEYAEGLGLPVDTAALAGSEPRVYDALALRADGTPIRVLHSDIGYGLLFDHPTSEALVRSCWLASRPLPAGLGTPVGLVVANPVLGSAAERADLTPNHYHGAVMWPWQHAMWIRGLERQLDRPDLSADARESARKALDMIRSGHDAARELRTAELWSWTIEAGQIRAVPFGQKRGHRAESNAAQLWSAVDLVLRPAS